MKGCICCDGVFSTILGVSRVTAVMLLCCLVQGQRNCRGVKRFCGVSTGFGVSTGVVKGVGRGNMSLGGAHVKGGAAGKSRVRWWVFTVGTEVSDRFVSMVAVKVI